MAKKPDDAMKAIMAEVTANLTQNLRDVLASALEKQLSTSLTQSLLESEFYRKISKDMRSGLRKIYKEVADVAQPHGATPDKATADKLFKDASHQLSAVLEQTEAATFQIMETIEKNMDLQEEQAKLLEDAKAGKPDWQRLEAINAQYGDDLVAMMTTLSFQDLTGQRLKKVLMAMHQLEATVLELYVSSGLLMKGYEEGQDMAALESKTKLSVEELMQKVERSELKGPSKDGSSQDDIDGLLAQFGL